MTSPIKPSDRFGLLTVIEDIGKRDKRGKVMWLCRCDCGNTKFVRADHLRDGILSCGCLARSRTKARMTKHGLTNHPLHEVWHGMLARCRNPKSKDYSRYGGRGISVCKEWATNFATFYNWAIQHGWALQLQIDRMDNNGDYTPANCRFVTAMENAHNKRNNRLITINGQTKCISEWERECSVHRRTILRRIRRGLIGVDLLAPAARRCIVRKDAVST